MSQDHQVLLNQIYRYQKYIYDATRRYYLFGRDKVIAQIANDPNSRFVVEVGCGNGRNLFKLAQRRPDLKLMGIDLCDELLDMAQARAQKFTQPMLFAKDYAANLANHLPENEKPDTIFASYTLSMMPDWQQTLSACLDCLAPGGQLHIVDFAALNASRNLFKRGLDKWLRMFHVNYHQDVYAHLQQHQQTHSLSLGMAQTHFRATLYPLISA